MMSRKIRALVLLILIMGIGLIAYKSTLSGLIMSIFQRNDSSHGVFVPFISSVLLWKRRGRLEKLEPGFSLLPGGIMVGMSILMFCLAGSNAESMLSILSFFMMVAGLVMAIFGMKVFKDVCFPLFFLLTMIPLPETVYAHVSEWMRAISTSGSVWMMQLFGIPFEREGYIIHLSEINLYVAESCSGIRYLLSYFVFGLAYAYVYKHSMKYRVVVVIVTLPVSVIAGVIRLFTIFLSVHYIGTFMAGHFNHVLLSWLVFLFILTGTIIIDQKLSARNITMCSKKQTT